MRSPGPRIASRAISIFGTVGAIASLLSCDAMPLSSPTVPSAPSSTDRVPYQPPEPRLPNYSPLQSPDGVLRKVGIYTYDGHVFGEPEFPHDSDGGYTIRREIPVVILGLSTPNTPDMRQSTMTLRVSWDTDVRGTVSEPSLETPIDRWFGWEVDVSKFPVGSSQQLVITARREGVPASTLAIPLRIKVE